MPFASGNTPVRTDSRWMLLVKLLGALQARAGSFAGNDGHRNDTLWMLMKKILRSRKGIDPGWPVAAPADGDWKVLLYHGGAIGLSASGPISGADGFSGRYQAASGGAWTEGGPNLFSDGAVHFNSVPLVLTNGQVRWTLAGAPVSDWSASKQFTPL